MLLSARQAKQKKQDKRIKTRKGIFLEALYDTMNGHFGDLAWWPAKTPFEVIVGAILTQNTAWCNVETAIINLKDAGIMSPTGLLAAEDKLVAALIRPSGYFNVKTHRLKSFVRYLEDVHGSSLDRMFDGAVYPLRESLLNVHGIGKETADCILLYAGGKPVFVVDAYTKRILLRHGMIREDAYYDGIQQLFMKNLRGDAALFNQYHALIVNIGKTYCNKKDPRCHLCPLDGMVYGKRKS
jgi:endonuclease III related protein